MMTTSPPATMAPGLAMPPASLLERGLAFAAWPAAIWIAWELLYYEQFKLTGNAGSVMLFTVLADWLHFPGGEAPFRIMVGLMELLAALLMALPQTRLYGGVLALGIMSGAIFFHTVSPLGIDPYHDGGVLFKEACFTWLMAWVVIAGHRRDVPARLRRYLPAGWRAFFAPRGA